MKSKLNQDITIKEIYDSKKMLEKQIHQVIQNFEQVTGCIVGYINFKFKEDEDHDMLSNKRPEIIGVELEMQLNNEHYDELSNNKK